MKVYRIIETGTYKKTYEIDAKDKDEAKMKYIDPDDTTKRKCYLETQLDNITILSLNYEYDKKAKKR